LNPAEPVRVWRVMSPTSYQAAPPREIGTTRLAFLLQPRQQKVLDKSYFRWQAIFEKTAGAESGCKKERDRRAYEGYQEL
jgi:hypothetical protein